MSIWLSRGKIVVAVARTAFCCCILLCAAAAARGEQLPLRTYTSAVGLAHNDILRIVRDSRGFLWFATAEGLSRFDSQVFTNYSTADGLPHRTVRDILETSRGEYWLATPNGVCRLNTSGDVGSDRRATCTPYTIGDREGQNVLRLYEGRDGAIWVGTVGGLYRLETSGGHISSRYVDLGIPHLTDQRVIQDILQDRHGALWVATRGAGLYRRLPDGRIEHYSLDAGVSTRVNALLEDRQGHVWAATAARGVLRFDTDAETNTVAIGDRLTAPETLVSNWATRLFESSDGTLWVSTTRGLTKLSPSIGRTSARSYTTSNGLPSLELTALAEDAAGNLWIGTPDRGAMKLARNGFVMFGKADGLGIPAAGSIFEDAAGDLYLFAEGVVSRLQARGFQNIRPKFPATVTGFSWGRDQIAFQDAFGEWWFATHQGLCRFPRVRQVQDLAVTAPRALYTTRDGLPGNVIYRVFGDSRGDVWINLLSDTGLHLVRWDRSSGEFHDLTVAEGWFPETWVAGFVEDRSGTLWIGTEQRGLLRLEEGRFHAYTAADGLQTNTVYDLHVDNRGRLWLALAEGGVAVIENPTAAKPQFRHYGTAAGLSSMEALAVTDDLAGNIYVLSSKGVDRLNTETGHVEQFTIGDGLPYSGALAYRDRHGALWFGSSYEIARFVPESDGPHSPPDVFISALRVSGNAESVPMLGARDLPTLVLQPTQNQIGIDFFGLMYRVGQTLKYQYRLEGADRTWTEPSDQRSVTYANLAPGDYRFLVRAIDANGVTSGSPASVTFRILPPFWRRWWFLALSAFAFGLALAAFHRYRLRQLVKLHEMRMRLATDLHDDIGASLARMAIMSEVARRQIESAPHESSAMLGDIANSARNVVESMRDIVWAIDPRRDTLDELLSRTRIFGATVLEPRGIQWDLDVGKDLDGITLDPETRRQLFLFFKEAIHNIVRHSACRSANVTIERCDGELVIQVRDDGRGLPPDLPQSTGGAGMGLTSMKARAAHIGGRLSVASVADKGTELTLRLPHTHR